MSVYKQLEELSDRSDAAVKQLGRCDLNPIIKENPDNFHVPGGRFIQEPTQFIQT